MTASTEKSKLFSVYSQRCAGFLMQRGFPLMDLAIGKNGRNIFMFRDTPAMRDALERWIILRASQQCKKQL